MAACVYNPWPAPPNKEIWNSRRWKFDIVLLKKETFGMCHLWWLFLTAIVRRETRLCRTEEEVETLKETCISHIHLSVTRISDKISYWMKDLVWFMFAESTWQKGYGGRDAGVEWGADQEPGAHRTVTGTHYQLNWRNSSTNLVQSCGLHCFPQTALPMESFQTGTCETFHSWTGGDEQEFFSEGQDTKTYMDLVKRIKLVEMWNDLG